MWNLEDGNKGKPSSCLGKQNHEEIGISHNSAASSSHGYWDVTVAASRSQGYSISSLLLSPTAWWQFPECTFLMWQRPQPPWPVSLVFWVLLVPYFKAAETILMITEVDRSELPQGRMVMRSWRAEPLNHFAFDYGILTQTLFLLSFWIKLSI